MSLAEIVMKHESGASRKESVKFRLFLPLLAYLLLPALASIAASTPPDLNTRDDVGAFMMTYYLQPRPDLIAGLIDALHLTGFVQKTAVSSVIGFFSEIFAANPDRIPNWQVLIAKQDQQTKAALDRALAVSKAGGVLNIDGHSAELNDDYWGAFFASGNPKFVNKLVDQLKFFDERDDFNLFMAGGTAMWSLASNAQSRPGVRTAIEKAKLTADKRTQDLITELLAQDPERIKQELMEIINKQKQTGKWGGRPKEFELVLQGLRTLSTRSASKGSEDVSDPKKIALRCAQETEKAPSYISELAIRDRTQKELASRDYVRLAWRIDFVRPDRYHVIQKGWGGGPDYVYDEWVTLGSEHYDNVGVWMKSDGTGRAKLNPRFRADKYLPMLRTEEPKSAAVYHHLGRLYYLLEYESADLGDFANFSESLIGPAHFRIWIDSETGLLAKGEFAARNKEPAGKETPFELEQAFAGYGLDIQIKAPQVQLGPEGSKK